MGVGDSPKVNAYPLSFWKVFTVSLVRHPKDPGRMGVLFEELVIVLKSSILKRGILGYSIQ